ncbi:hypothetical protein HAX54_053384, partial [Datura stramonium]|nr:hypothetical protein [Datura stramonium]
MGQVRVTDAVVLCSLDENRGYAQVLGPCNSPVQAVPGVDLKIQDFLTWYEGKPGSFMLDS